MARDTIGPFEFDILRSLNEQPSDAYGITLRDRLQERRRRKVSLGSVYSSLERLETKGMISSWWEEGTRERGGRRKRLYRIEAPGYLAASRFASRFQGSVFGVGGVA
jgi:PadR family transcriptional regulator PadR